VGLGGFRERDETSSQGGLFDAAALPEDQA